LQYDEIQFDNKSHEVQVFPIDMIFVTTMIKLRIQSHR